MKNTFLFQLLLKTLIIIILECFFCSAIAGTLKGTVVDRNGRIKKYARVEIGETENLTTFTDQEGKFSAILEGGKYSIKIIERNRSMVFQIDIPSDTSITKQIFKLKW